MFMSFLIFRKKLFNKKKHVKACLDVEFLIKCKTFNVIPKFLRFKLYKKSLRSASFYRSWQTKLLNYEIICKKKDIKELTVIIKNDGTNVRKKEKWKNNLKLEG